MPAVGEAFSRAGTVVSGNILGSAHGGVGYLQPRGRVSSSRSIWRWEFSSSVISLNSKAFTTVMNKFGLLDTNQQRGRQTRSKYSAFQNIWFSGYKQSKIVLPALFRASRDMHVLHQSSGNCTGCQWKVVSFLKFYYKFINHRSLNNLAPAYINSLLKNYKPSRNLRSVDQGLLTVPRSNQRTYGDRAFSVAAPKLWNALPLDIRNSGSITLFKCKLKTFLFKKYYL